MGGLAPMTFRLLTHVSFALAFFTMTTVATVVKNSEFGFSVAYDAARWESVPNKEEKESPSGKTLLTLQRKLADEKYHPRFSVVMDDLKKFNPTGPDRLLAYQKHAIDFLKEQRFSVRSPEPFQLRGVPEKAVEIVATQRDFGLTFRQVVFLRNDKAYLLTSAVRTAKARESLPETQTFFDSFQFAK
jgi:hypothetical protein